MKSQKTNEISLFFAVDDGYCPFLSVTLDSIMKNCNQNFSYTCYILNSGISEQNKKILEERLTNNFSLEFVDLTEKIQFLSEKLHTRDYYSKTTYYRLFIPEMFPNLDKALYLDSDIIVLGDISELYNLELNNNLVGAVTDSAVQNTPVFIDYVEQVLGVKGNKYFNAGVLLMNLKEMREFKFEDKFIDLLSKYTFSVAQDQDYLNTICYNKVAYADFSWNAMPIPNDKCKPNKLNLIHFNMLWKPWKFENTIYEEFFWEYAKNNPFYDIIIKNKQSYTEEQKQKDIAGGAGLLKLCEIEINKPDNYKKKYLDK